MSDTGYVLKTHAVARFIEKVRPALRWAAAEREFEGLLKTGTMVEDPPGWLAARALQDAERYVAIGEDIVAPLAASRERPGEWLVLTCITRGGVSDLARERRKQLRADRSSTRVLARGHGRRGSGGDRVRDHRASRRHWNTTERFEHVA
jgi:hypothetical protein